MRVTLKTNDRRLHEGSASADSSEEKQSMRQRKDGLSLILAVALGERIFDEMAPQHQIEGRKGKGY